MSHADAADIRERVRIEDLVQRAGLHIDGKGHTLSTQEHDSLRLFTHNNSWFWYSKGIGGSVIDWVMHWYKVDFQKALDILEGTPAPAVAQNPITPPPPPAPLPQDLHLRYHRQLDDNSRAWWHAQGITNEAISRFFLGVCRDRADYGTCYTLPVIEAGRLVNLRLRLEQPPKPKDKYRPWAAGHGTQLFNADILTPELGGVVIVAGEKKAIVLWENGIPAISATGGCGNWRDEWTTRLQHCRKVYIAFDPNESAAAWKLAGAIGERAYVVNLPDKPDDFILAQGESSFRTYLRSAEPYADRSYWQRQLGGGRALWGRMLE